MSKLDINILKKLGKLTREIRKEVHAFVKEGIDITEIIDYVETKIFKEGYLPAFPCTVSINDVAAHYTVFDKGQILKTGDLIKVDFGISQNGFITDNAFSIEINTNKYEKLMKANKEGLDSLMKSIQLGTTMSELGEKVDLIAKKHGFNTIHNLCGHQIAINNLHCGMSVPNYKNGDTHQVVDNSEFAIEPFFTLGAPKIKAGHNGNILEIVNDKPVRDPIAKKVLNYIKENYPYLPFSKRWLVEDIIRKINPKAPKAFEKSRVLYALRVLKSNNIIYEHDALVTIDGAIVSQYEDVVVFVDGTKTIITREK